MLLASRECPPQKFVRYEAAPQMIAKIAELPKLRSRRWHKRLGTSSGMSSHGSAVQCDFGNFGDFGNAYWLDPVKEA